MRGLVVATIVAVLSMLFPAFAAAQAAPPPNDAIGDATVITELPFADVVDTTSATVDAGDPICGDAASTVWYAFTPPADMRLAIDAYVNGFATTAVGVYSGSPGALTELACAAFPGRLLLDVQGGETYYFMADSCCESPAGTLTITLDEAPPVVVAGVTIGSRGTVDRFGTAEVSVTVFCDQATQGYVYVVLEQAWRRTRIVGTGSAFVECTPPFTTVDVTVVSDGSFILATGKTRADVGTELCGPFECGYAEISNQPVQLRRGHE